MLILKRKGRRASPDVQLHADYQLAEVVDSINDAIEAKAVLVLVSASGKQFRFRPAECVKIYLTSKES